VSISMEKEMEKEKKILIII